MVGGLAGVLTQSLEIDVRKMANVVYIEFLFIIAVDAIGASLNSRTIS